MTQMTQHLPQQNNFVYNTNLHNNYAFTRGVPDRLQIYQCKVDLLMEAQGGGDLRYQATLFDGATPNVQVGQQVQIFNVMSTSFTILGLRLPLTIIRDQTVSGIWPSVRFEYGVNEIDAFAWKADTTGE